MPKQVVRRITPLHDEDVAAMEGKYIGERHFNRLIRIVPADVYKPDGSPLLLYRPAAIPLDVCNKARPALRKAAYFSEHRKLNSGIVGYWSDRPGECRKTAFTRDDTDRWGSLLPFIRCADSAFRRHMPGRYQVQRDAAMRTDPSYVIGSTPFTTVTVNLWDETHDARTRVHKDAGDLPEGFGVISILRSGNYSGGYLIFPKYEIAVDLRTTDLLFCDVHEFHGNAQIVGDPGFERIACILYYRSELTTCRH